MDRGYRRPQRLRSAGRGDDRPGDGPGPADGDARSGPTPSGQGEDPWLFGEDDAASDRRPALNGGLQWRVARSAALVFLGIALAVGAALFLVRSPEPPAAALSVQLEDPQADTSTDGDDAAGSEGRESAGPVDAPPDAAVQDARDRETDRDDAPGAPDAPGGSSSGGSAASGEVGDGVPRTIWVYVTGAVVAPGVVEIGADARLADVLGSVGGALPEADLERVNLAARPTDGQHLHLPAVGEEAEALPAGPPVPVQPPSMQAGPGAEDRPAGGDPDDGVIDINAATLTEIESLPRVGPVLGQRILDWRTDHGPFLQASDIDAVPGIGPALLEGILPRIVVR